MSKMIYINLPVTDLAAATRFYEAIGCEKNEQFSDHQSSSMVWSDTITFQLLANDYFSTFTPKKIADAHATSEVLFALSHDNREQVDAIVEAAAATGGKADIRERQDLGWLYNRTFEDPDGHVFEAISMEAGAVPAEVED
ncbi:VOC family protein [Bosea sp. (in: a-proteobacteria)]|uniref:VOC family protein n=1 Tax=Bosea sp. (in: a-proteobacteria) TaxID=1871050 RepID=UPI002FCB9A97